MILPIEGKRKAVCQLFSDFSLAVHVLLQLLFGVGLGRGEVAFLGLMDEFVGVNDGLLFDLKQ